VQPLGGGLGLRLTTAKYYTPSNRVIHEVGISPDLAVPITDAEDRAIILSEAKRALSPEEQIEVAGMEDRQLERAVSVLRSWKAYRERQSAMPPGAPKTPVPEKSTDSTASPDSPSH
jgi:carboxyl-terminal processing protease